MAAAAIAESGAAGLAAVPEGAPEVESAVEPLACPGVVAPGTPGAVTPLAVMAAVASPAAAIARGDAVPPDAAGVEDAAGVATVLTGAGTMTTASAFGIAAVPAVCDGEAGASPEEVEAEDLSVDLLVPDFVEEELDEDESALPPLLAVEPPSFGPPLLLLPDGGALFELAEGAD